MSKDDNSGRAYGGFLAYLRSVFFGKRIDPPADSSAVAAEAGTTLRPAANNDIAPLASISALAVDAATVPSAEALINEGLRERQKSGSAAAQSFFERAAQLAPQSHVPWFMLGNVASELGELDAAVAYYTRARNLRPTDHVILYNLGLNQLWRGYIDAAIEELRAACNLAPSYLLAHSSLIMALFSSDRVLPEEVSAVIRGWGVRFALEHPEEPASRFEVDRPPPLRVGFVSGDFRVHSVAHFFEPILSTRDQAAFVYVLYSTARSRDSVTERLRSQANEWREVWQLGDDALIDLIRADRIDILVDLAGHTADNRLAVFARRAAPVQISYLGYPASTGLATMDYRITDAVTDPPTRGDDWHCERLLRMPDTQWCFRPFGNPGTPGQLPAREAGFVRFGSFNNLTKASDTLLRCWIEILLRLPTSRLRLTRLRSNQRAAEILCLFERSGVSPQRIECVPYANEPPYGRQFAGVDISLDNFPYNGVTTTCESLYFGVPVISLYGRSGVSRSGLSLLNALGLQELAAATQEQYRDIAVALASDVPRLERLRTSLRDRFESSSLRDEKKFGANFEALLKIAWARRVELSASLPSVSDH